MEYNVLLSNKLPYKGSYPSGNFHRRFHPVDLLTSPAGNFRPRSYPKGVPYPQVFISFGLPHSGICPQSLLPVALQPPHPPGSQPRWV